MLPASGGRDSWANRETGRKKVQQGQQLATAGAGLLSLLLSAAPGQSVGTDYPHCSSTGLAQAACPWRGEPLGADPKGREGT